MQASERMVAVRISYKKLWMLLLERDIKKASLCLLYTSSWLWETLGIALVAAAVCVACAALIGKAAKKKLSKKVLAVIGLSLIHILRSTLASAEQRFGKS